MNKNTEDKNRVISNVGKDSNPTCSDDDWLDKVEVARDTGDIYPDNDSTNSEKKSGGTYEIKTETPRKEQRLFSFLFREYNEDCVRSDMIDVIIPLVPLVVWGIYLFGLRVLTLALISVISCVVLDVIASLILKDKEAASDLSSVVIGLMTVLCLPPTAPLWLPRSGGNYIRRFCETPCRQTYKNQASSRSGGSLGHICRLSCDNDRSLQYRNKAPRPYGNGRKL